jgi:S1-C subfamily serine protease
MSEKMNEIQLLEVIEQYLNGSMSEASRKKFELLRNESAEIDEKVVEHQLFTNLLKQYGERVELENRLNAIHEEIDVHTLKENLMAHPSWVVQLWRHHHSKISVAASVAIFAVLSILMATGKLNNSNPNIVELSRKVDRLDRSNKSLSRSINNIKSGKAIISDKYTGTGTCFAITSDGLLATNYHVIQGADSIYVQNAAGTSFKAKVLYTEPQNDIAILKITDDSFENLGTIPYTLKRAESPLAEHVSTYGYPDGYPAYNPGYLSAQSGLNGDSLHYKVTIPINPGNSGGPLWDSKGYIIGITDAKQTQLEGAHYAIKAKYLLDAIHNIPGDSLTKKINLNKKNTLAGLSEVQKTEKAKKYVFMVKVYN